MYDSRDNEPAPNSGMWSEVSVRGASPLWGSTWSYLGVNVTLRDYHSWIPEKLVSASRVALDNIWGDPSVLEMARMGGAKNYTAIGGQFGGRGMRVNRFLGQTKALLQEELRWTFAGIDTDTQSFDFGLVGFFDYGFSASDIASVSSGEGGYGTGGGLRVTWNENFIVRVDAGFSPVEDWGNKLYINLDHIY